jgi:two-component system copper resistance phosphate regulon response regulator CusR
MHLLFAEDDRQLRASMLRGLREASYSVDQAGTGPRAIALALANRYDAMILDVLLPGADGLEVCRQIRAAGQQVPILMLTALDGVEQRIAGLDAGADDYLAKPFDFGELLARLRALTRRHGETARGTSVGDVRIDLARHEAWCGENKLALTLKEFALLGYLARHAGHVVSRAELLQHVWDDPGNAYSNIIDVYASRLRRKLDEAGSSARVITVRGVGFLLETTAPASVAHGARQRAPTTRR